MNPSTSAEIKQTQVVQTKPDISLVTVADFEYNENHNAITIEAVIYALASQDYEGTVELVVCESEKRPSPLSESLLRRIPSLRVLRLPYTSSYELLNAGVRAASADIVGFVDHDAVLAGCLGAIQGAVGVVEELSPIALELGARRVAVGASRGDRS